MHAMLLVFACAALLPHTVQAADVTVEIEGVDDELLDNVRGYLGIWQYRNEEDLTELSIRRLHARAPDEIRDALLPFGFYKPDIRARLQVADGKEDSWLARYEISPGIPVIVEKLDVTIDGPESLRRASRELLANSALKEGDRLHHGHYGRLKDEILSRALRRGYLDARFTTQELRVDRDTYSAHIVLKLDAGQQFLFGEVEFRQDLLDEDFLERYVEFKPGTPFDYGEMLDLRYALGDTDYYADIEVRADRAGEIDGRVPVIVEAERNNKHRYTFGLGFGTDTGLRASAGWQNRYVNRRGHKAGAQVQVAEISKAMGISYSIPLKKPRTDRFMLTASWEDEDFGDERSIKRVIGANLIRMLGPWQRTLFVRYEQERDTTTIGANETELVLPGVSFLKVSSDHPLFPTHGYKLFYELRGASETLGSDVGFAQLRFQTKRVYTPFEDWRALFRVEAAGTKIDETASLPVSQRFFAGGDRSVRGFDYNRLGPTDDDENVVGGKYLITGSAELEHMFTDSWGMAAFVDAGNAADQWDMSLEVGVGFGVRWRSPLGMIRLDFATPLDKERRPPNNVEIHISIGPDL